jgi:hypothetical protein
MLVGGVDSGLCDDFVEFPDVKEVSGALWTR